MAPCRLSRPGGQAHPRRVPARDRNGAQAPAHGQKRESILFPAQGADLSNVEEKEGPGRLAETEGFEPSIRLESV